MYLTAILSEGYLIPRKQDWEKGKETGVGMLFIVPVGKSPIMLSYISLARKLVLKLVWET